MLLDQKEEPGKGAGDGVEGRNALCWRARLACRSILAETSTTFVKCALIGEG